MAAILDKGAEEQADLQKQIMQLRTATLSKDNATEVDTLKKLKHPNIVNMVEVGEGMQTNSKKNASKNVKYIVLELVGGGELFDLVALGGKLTEPFARYYFK